ncbi:MAG: di-trans,poly-cis-decaprenylcistransferase [Bacilli bacterium]|nr:di-trans,poly-cis-decaprenylcistransferase [Bacilli bacterium]
MDNTILKIPNHVAIILDGNGRWAKEKGLKRTEGHKAGYENLKKISKYILNKGTKYLSVFAFSTENFNRPYEEVDFLMNLFIKGFKKDFHYFNDENIKVVFSGKEEKLNNNVINAMKEMEESTKNNTGGTLNICLNYGGRAEIIDAVNKIINDKIDKVTEDDFKKYLYKDLPDIDLLIRTSGELRISNFMLWQLSYSELYFPKCYFPDFNQFEYDKALYEYTSRDRRFGGLNNE